VQDLGRSLIVFGAIAILVGLVLLVAPRIPWLGRLPGDILVRRDNFTLYFPLATGLIVSLVITLLLNLFWRR
jgi:DUF2905 family protein